MALRVIGTRPAAAGMLRLDKLVAGLARERLWITDAYFVGVPGYVQALTAAAADGVDVRLLVPGGSDLPLVQLAVARRLPRAARGRRPGVRVERLDDARQDRRGRRAWARVGSTNLNVQSWMGNWELDVAIEDAGFGAAMERMFEADLANATEVVLDRAAPRAAPRRTRIEPPTGSSPARGAAAAPPAAAGAMRFGNTMGAALTARRALGAAEGRRCWAAASCCWRSRRVAAWWPASLAWPVACAAAWLGRAAGVARRSAGRD